MVIFIMEIENTTNQQETTQTAFSICSLIFISMGFIILGILGWRLGNVYLIGVSVIGIILCLIVSGLIINSSYLIDLWSLAMVASSLIFLPYQGMTRIWMNIPIGYIPFFAVIFVIFLSSTRERGRMALHSGNVFSDLSLYALLFYGLTSSLWAIDIGRWFVYMMMWLVYIFTIYFPMSFNFPISKHRFIVILNYLYYSLGIMAFIGLIKYFLLNYPDSNPMPFINRNGVIYIYVSFIPLIIASYLHSKLKRYIIIFFIITLDIVFMYSRTGYISWLFALLASIFFIRFKDGNKRIVPKLSVFFSVVMLFIMIYAIPKLNYSFISRLNSIVDFEEKIFFLAAPKRGEPDWRRYTLIETSIMMFKRSPFVGTGMGQYVSKFPDDVETAPANPHTLYLSFLAEFGIIGFAPLMFFLVSIFINYWKNTRALQTDTSYIGYGFMIGHLTLLVAFTGNGYIPLLFYGSFGD